MRALVNLEKVKEKCPVPQNVKEKCPVPEMSRPKEKETENVQFNINESSSKNKMSENVLRKKK